MTSQNQPPAASAPRTRGVFIAFEGGDSAGKTTQARLLTEHLEAAGHAVLRTREPGGTVVGEKIRALVLEHGHGEIDARTEALLFAAARAAHAAQAIRPALERGEVVITDRYIDSSVAYQGAGRSLGAAAVRDLNDWATEGLRPDLTILLNVDPTHARSRRLGLHPGDGDSVHGGGGDGRSNNSCSGNGHGEDRLESEPDIFHSRIRGAFLALAEADPERYLVLDAAGPVEAIAARISERVAELPV